MTQAIAPKSPLATLADYINARSKAIQAVLPQTMKADRLLKIALAAASRTPKLLQCTPESFYIALHTSAQLGLEPCTPLGHAYLVPYMNNKTGRMEAQFQPGYRGLIDLARRGGQISTIYAYPVRAGDKFKLTLGMNPDIMHEPTADAEADVMGVYAVCKLKDGGVQFDYMRRSEVDAIRKRSRASDSGPWVSDYVEMAKKTVVKRLCKYLPLSIELASAIEQDDAAETGDLVEVFGKTIADAPLPEKKSLKEQLKEPAPASENSFETTPQEEAPVEEKKEEPKKAKGEKKTSKQAEQTEQQGTDTKEYVCKACRDTGKNTRGDPCPICQKPDKASGDPFGAEPEKKEAPAEDAAPADPVLAELDGLMEKINAATELAEARALCNKVWSKLTNDQQAAARTGFGIKDPAEFKALNLLQLKNFAAECVNTYKAG